MVRRRISGRGRLLRRIFRPASWATIAWAVIASPACSLGGSANRESAGYLCPELVERCRACRAASPDFRKGDCEGDVLERCRTHAARRPSWLRHLAQALASDSCREFEQAL